jgi:hypothetical protein
LNGASSREEEKVVERKSGEKEKEKEKEGSVFYLQHTATPHHVALVSARGYYQDRKGQGGWRFLSACRS